MGGSRLRLRVQQMWISAITTRGQIKIQIASTLTLKDL
jgi:hypothetical protein